MRPLFALHVIAGFAVLLVGCSWPIPDCEDGWSGVTVANYGEPIVRDAAGAFELDGAHYDSCREVCERANPTRGPLVSCSFHEGPVGEATREPLPDGYASGSIECVHDGATCDRDTIVKGPEWNL